MRDDGHPLPVEKYLGAQNFCSDLLIVSLPKLDLLGLRYICVYQPALGLFLARLYKLTSLKVTGESSKMSAFSQGGSVSHRIVPCRIIVSYRRIKALVTLLWFGSAPSLLSATSSLDVPLVIKGQNAVLKWKCIHQ